MMWRAIASNALTLFVVVLFAVAGLLAWGQRVYVGPGPAAVAAVGWRARLVSATADHGSGVFHVLRRRRAVALNRQRIHIDGPADDLPMRAAQGVQIGLPVG